MKKNIVDPKLDIARLKRFCHPKMQPIIREPNGEEDALGLLLLAALDLPEHKPSGEEILGELRKFDLIGNCLGHDDLLAIESMGYDIFVSNFPGKTLLAWKDVGGGSVFGLSEMLSNDVRQKKTLTIERYRTDKLFNHTFLSLCK